MAKKWRAPTSGNAGSGLLRVSRKKAPLAGLIFAILLAGLLVAMTMPLFSKRPIENPLERRQRELRECQAGLEHARSAKDSVRVERRILEMPSRTGDRGLMCGELLRLARPR